MNRHRIISNMLKMGVGQLSTWSLSLVYFVVIGRYLGPARFGELALAKSVVLVVWLGATLGMELLVTRTVAREPERTGPVTSAAMVARTILAVPVLAAIYIFSRIAHYDSDVSAAIYLYGLAEILWSVERILLATFQGREHMGLNSLWTLVRNGLTLALALLIIRRHGGVVAFAAIELPIAIVLFAVTMTWMRRFGPLTWRVSQQDLREVIVGGIAFWANEVFFTVYLYIDTVILAALAGTVAVGIYTPATQMFSVAMFLTGIIGPATLPQLARLGINRDEDFQRAARKVISLFVIAGVPMTIGLTTFAQTVIVAIFGPDYRASVPVLVALSLAIVPMFLNFQFSQTLAASDRQWWWAAALAGACVINPLLNLFCIPLAEHAWHNAALGAAIAWLITELAEVGYGCMLLPSVVLSRDLGRTIVGVAVAGGAQLGTVWLIGAAWLPLGEAAGVVVFSSVAVALGTIPREDLKLLLDAGTRSIRRRDVAIPAAGAK